MTGMPMAAVWRELRKHARFDERMWERVTAEPLRHRQHRGGNSYVQPTATAPHLDFTLFGGSLRRNNTSGMEG